MHADAMYAQASHVLFLDAGLIRRSATRPWTARTATAEEARRGDVPGRRGLGRQGLRIIDEFKSQNAKVATAVRATCRLAAKKVSWKMLCGVVKETFKEIFDARAEKMGITRLLATTYDNTGDGTRPGRSSLRRRRRSATPGRPPRPARRPSRLEAGQARAQGRGRRSSASSAVARDDVIDLRGDSDVEMMARRRKAQQAPIEIDSDAAPSPIAVDADGTRGPVRAARTPTIGRASSAARCAAGNAVPRGPVLCKDTTRLTPPPLNRTARGDV